MITSDIGTEAEHWTGTSNRRTLSGSPQTVGLLTLSVYDPELEPHFYKESLWHSTKFKIIWKLSQEFENSLTLE